MCILIKERYLEDATIYIYIIYDDDKYARRYLLFLRAAVLTDEYVYYICIVVAYVETHKGRTVYDDYAIRPMSVSRTIIFFLLKRIYLSPSMRDVYV